MRLIPVALAGALLLGACSPGPSEIAEPDDQQVDEAEQAGGSTAVRLRRMATLSGPTALAVRPGDERAYYIAERAGRVRRLVGKRMTNLVLDIRSAVGTAGEGGLLGIAFSPNGRRLYLNYTDTGGNTRVVRYFMNNNNRARTGTRVQLLRINQPYSNHNGGDIHIGPDKYLYIALGDGGSGGDPHGHGQNRGTLLGSILRIDPLGSPYRSPPDNPFVGQSGRRNEILHYGVRNPWRIWIDRQTSTLWVADVGQNRWEEISRIPLPKKGANLGWARMEGLKTYGGRTEPSNHHRPIHVYGHSGGRCSITGGVVMRDPRLPALKGRYVFSDFCDGKIRSLRKTNDGWRASSLGISASGIASFGQLANGRTFVLSLNGGVFRIDPA